MSELVPRNNQPQPLSLPEELSQQFYDWEKRGRGWQVWDYPVVLEPPFRPFFYYAPEIKPGYDDGRVPGVLESLWDMVTPAQETQVVSNPPEFVQEYPPDSYQSDDFVEIQVGLPASAKIRAETAEHLFVNLSYCSYPVSFELLGLPDRIILQFACHKDDEHLVHQKLRAYFPEAILTRTEGTLANSWNDLRETVIADFCLSREFLIPLKPSGNPDADIFIGLVGALEHIQAGELGLFQIMFQRSVYPWDESINRAVTDGKSFFEDAPHLFALAQEKIRKYFFSVIVRVAAQSDTHARSLRIAQSMGGSLTQCGTPSSNELFPISNKGYSDSDHAEDVVHRRTHRSGMLLNSEELASLAHLPPASVVSNKLRPKIKKTKQAPPIAAGHDLILGENQCNGTATQVTLSPEQRVKHTYIVGASGTGKSTLLLSLIIQDIQKGRGVGVLDPHGDLIDQILGNIPDNRIDDVILLDPSDEEYPIGFNILSAHSELERNLLSSDLVSVFQRLSTSWGDQMTSVLGNAILAFLESEQGGTLSDLRRFLVEKDFRNSFLETVKDPEVVYYWRKEFPLLSGRPQAPILTRLDAFLRPKLIRYMVSQKENKLNLGTVMNGNKIFLAKLSQGAIGEENAYLLGTFLVSKFHQAAMSRQEIKESERKNFFLYIDEFHNFITPSMASILSGARKYRLGLTLSHQELRQLKDSEVKSAVLSNPYTRICFRVGDEDAQKLADGFSTFDAKDLQNLGVGEAICRMERADFDFNLQTFPLPEIPAETANAKHEKVKAVSRERYGTKREEVEAELARRFAKIPVIETEETPEIPEVRPTPIPDAEVRVPVNEDKPAKPKRPTVVRPEEPLPGRGGQQHKYLQQLVKKCAEDKGYHASIEKEVLDGAGSVDVVLEKGKQAIACEVSITTDAEQELGNLRKCLKANFEKIVLISPHRKLLNQVREAADPVISKEDLAKISFLTPEDFFGFMEEQAAQSAGTETTICGYKVKTNYRALDPKEKEMRKQSIAQTILRAMKRLQGK